MLQPSDITPYFGYAGWLTMIGLVWKAGQRVGQIEAKLQVLSTNHLPHLEMEIRELRKDVRALTDRELSGV